MHKATREPQLCSECGETFMDLRKHWRRKHNPETHPCSYCGKIFHNMTALKAHEDRHTKPYPCAHCDKNFGTKSSLRYHTLNLHSKDEDKPFICNICSKGFCKGADLKQHLNIHSRSFPFSCKHCDRRFNAFSNCHTHQKKCQLKTSS